MDFMSLGLTNVVAITAICYLIGSIVKTSGVDNKWIPCVCGISGMILGMVSMSVMPEFPANDYVTAAAIGIASGLAATGIDQSIKQLNHNEKGE